MSISLKIVGGRFRHGKPARVPWLCSDTDLPVYLSTLSMDEVIDLACMLEFHVLNSSREDYPREAQSQFAKLFRVFQEEIKNSCFVHELDLLKLRTSIDRVNFGRRLSEG